MMVLSWNVGLWSLLLQHSGIVWVVHSNIDTCYNRRHCTVSPSITQLSYFKCFLFHFFCCRRLLCLTQYLKSNHTELKCSVLSVRKHKTGLAASQFVICLCHHHSLFLYLKKELKKKKKESFLSLRSMGTSTQLILWWTTKAPGL